MFEPKTVNALMRHLRESGISINGSIQKKQLINFGYYHGYKGYRFYRNRNQSIPYTEFNQLIGVMEYDNALKAMMYPVLMFIETAVKNIVCNEIVLGMNTASFEAIFREKMSDFTEKKDLMLRRLRLRDEVYKALSREYNNKNKMVEHFYNKGDDVPIWAIFEILSLGIFSNFVYCLDTESRRSILKKLDMIDVACDSNYQLLPKILFELKSLRNAIAHNSVVFDARFKDQKVSPVLKGWLEKETGINNISFYSISDYLILICSLLKKLM